jgi:hypothetical protein
MTFNYWSLTVPDGTDGMKMSVLYTKPVTLLLQRQLTVVNRAAWMPNGNTINYYCTNNLCMIGVQMKLYLDIVNMQHTNKPIIFEKANTLIASMECLSNAVCLEVGISGLHGVSKTFFLSRGVRDL